VRKGNGVGEGRKNESKDSTRKYPRAMQREHVEKKQVLGRTLNATQK